MLQKAGTRTSVTDAEIAGNTSNEAIQFNLMYAETRDKLLRMAPWDCGMKTANLTYISSLPGTPENQSAATALWIPGQPSPPWAYEYQYPVDCLRMQSVLPTMQTGFASGIPITTAVTGGASSYLGPPVRFKVQTDTFIPVTAAAVASGGTSYAVGDVITLAGGSITNPPIGAPAQLVVTAANAGVITAVSIVNVVNGEASAIGGSYFAQQTNPVAQGSTTGSGSGATFNLTYGSASPQRVVLTNQEFATAKYVQQVLDPNVFDPAFRDALYSIGGAILAMSLLTDKKLIANILIREANDTINKARTMDGNESLTVNDVTPDWIRFRGIWYTEGYISGPYSGFDWGSLWPSYF